MNDRKNAIYNTLVQGRNLNPKDPAYIRYFNNYFMTDAKLIKEFANVRTIFEIRGYVNSLITAVNEHAVKTRKALIEAHANGAIDDDIFDGLYGHFTQCYIQKFKKEAAKCLAHIDRVIANKEYKDVADSYKSDMNSLYRNPSAYTDIPSLWMNTYTDVITGLAEIMSGVYRAIHGKADEVRTEVASFVS